MGLGFRVPFCLGKKDSKASRSQYKVHGFTGSPTTPPALLLILAEGPCRYMVYTYNRYMGNCLGPKYIPYTSMDPLGPKSCRTVAHYVSATLNNKGHAGFVMSTVSPLGSHLSVLTILK